MKLRFVPWAALALPAAGVAIVATATPSCSNNSGGNVALGGGCTLNSDCKDPLHCIFQLCHQQCAKQEDCTQPGAYCLNDVCVTQQEDACTTPGSTASCTTLAGTTCVDTGGGTDKCLTACTPGGTPCTPGQTCGQASGAQVCLPTPEAGTSSGGNDGGGGDGGGSSGGDASSHDGGPAQEAGILGYVPSNFGSVTFAEGGIPEAGEGGTPIVGA